LLRTKLAEIAAALGRTVPSDLEAAVEVLSRSAWPEMVRHWSRLTPTGFPVELTVTDADPVLRWTAEIAGPEIAEAHRLGLAAVRLCGAGQPVQASLLDAIEAAQRGRDLRYGAWLGGRAADGAPSRLKLYAEIPSDAIFREFAPELMDVVAHAPQGALVRMIGVEPALSRVEVYLRLPALAPDDLRPLLTAAGHPEALDVLERGLPDGTRRLAGRRLGISVASAPRQPIDVALFASARSLFPAGPDMLRKLVPAVASMPEGLASFTLVTLSLNPEANKVAFAVGVTAKSGRKTRRAS
jgi:hypothetical protein